MPLGRLKTWYRQAQGRNKFPPWPASTGRSLSMPSAGRGRKPRTRPTPTSPPSRLAKFPSPALLSLTEVALRAEGYLSLRRSFWRTGPGRRPLGRPADQVTGRAEVEHGRTEGPYRARSGVRTGRAPRRISLAKWCGRGWSSRGKGSALFMVEIPIFQIVSSVVEADTAGRAVAQTMTDIAISDPVGTAGPLDFEPA